MSFIHIKVTPCPSPEVKILSNLPISSMITHFSHKKNSNMCVCWFSNQTIYFVRTSQNNSAIKPNLETERSHAPRTSIQTTLLLRYSTNETDTYLDDRKHTPTKQRQVRFKRKTRRKQTEH
jgi:hypothetical protein